MNIFDNPSFDDKDKPLHIIKGFWDLISAISLIRSFQPAAHSVGFNLCLGGGVLNNGFSSNDLDIIAVPRSVELEANTAYLLSLFKQTNILPFELKAPKRKVYRCRPLPNFPAVDLIIFSR